MAGRKVKFDVTCRYGITYNVELHGSEGAKLRTLDMLKECCCFVCHNHDCKEPRDEQLLSCKKECQFYTDKPYCKK